MNPAPQRDSRIHRPTPAGDAAVIDVTGRWRRPGVDRHGRPETVILGLSRADHVDTALGGGARPDPWVAQPGRPRDRAHRLTGAEDVAVGVTWAGAAPRPPRYHGPFVVLASLVLAGGGVAAVWATGRLAGVPTVAMVSLVAAVICGAILVAAQVTHEVGSRRRR